MFIKKLVVKNYKLLKDVTIELNKDINILLERMIPVKVQFLKLYQLLHQGN